ncbi:cytochrome c peroxidase [Geopsychrobacter electrodiphilus]|uniref:cytochrome c peroxidase n=1 Tax=Geopsychrobacter electrodiphilus TaxID=225196 RepID=UPI000373E388|nr:cytochrome c peroxidase [Geopsychrobacter electrodiphilus]
MKLILTIMLLMFVASPCLAAQAPTADLGKQLFESPTLGSNGKSCSSCHSQGKGLEKIAGYDDAKLKGRINSCIRGALKGKVLALESTELDSMLIYLRSLQPGS